MNLGREEHVYIWYKFNYEPARCAYSSGIDLKFDWTHFLHLGATHEAADSDGPRATRDASIMYTHS
jgi:hypothetical protein